MYTYMYTYGNQSHIWIWSCLIKVDHSSVMTIIYLFIHVFYRCSILYTHYMGTTFKLIEHFVEEFIFNLILYQWEKIIIYYLFLKWHNIFDEIRKKPNTLFNVCSPFSALPCYAIIFFFSLRIFILYNSDGRLKRLRLFFMQY